MGALNNFNWNLFKSAFTESLSKKDDSKIKGVSGWNDNTTAKWNQIKQYFNKYGISDSTALSILETYKPETLLGSNFPDIIDRMLSDIQEMDSWTDYVGEAPTMPSAEDFYTRAEADINKENEELSAIYDSIFKNETEGLSKIMEDNNAMFNDYRNQTLTNNALSQQAIAGSTRFELERQQRTAISRGASAAQRLVANINTSLGMQAQSAQQALETSNALAQNLLAHRQANENVRSSYMNAQKEDSLRRADLISGRTERINANKDSYLNTAMNAYDVENTAYNDRVSKTQGTNPWSSAWTSWYTKNQNNKTRNAI